MVGRSEEVWLWYTAVFEAIQEIPYGKVTSYGHIARLVGKREGHPPCDCG
jgi:methylated-DNA-protein-cysteine methyltransferase-like protein